MFSVFGVEGQVVCCKGSQCGDYHDSWPPVTTTASSHHPGEGVRLISSHGEEVDATAANCLVKGGGGGGINTRSPPWVDLLGEGAPEAPATALAAVAACWGLEFLPFP